MRLPILPLTAGAVAAALGLAGLVRGAEAQPPAASMAGPIAVTNAYVRAPVPPSRTAAGYFTVDNTGATDDRLLGVETAVGAMAVLHTVNRNGSMSATADGVVIHAHSKFVLATGQGHVMIEHVYRTLSPGQRVDLELDFQHAGVVHVSTPASSTSARR